MAKKFSTTLVAALTVSIGAPKAFAADMEEHHFYVNKGISWLNNDVSSEQAWMSSIGYNYLFNSSIGVDIGYLDVSSDDTYTSRYSTLMPTSVYKGVFGGAKFLQPISNLALLYAKGGISLASYQSDLALRSRDGSLSNYLMSPYFSIGANLPSLFEPNLDLNLELSYQDLDLDYSNTILMLGAQYRF